ncbi:uncharacterized protein LOC125026493 [Penaeus chinensis]|uniref:uncharacterized protein LOC125026493 n=1 Tax=Penaeus chinensis TaxID=139456 RepID=UPI001FB5F2A7|nr:uncharacterized protein LOC125026493 [Penaeus chinensis]
MEDNRTYLPPEWNNEERMRVLLGPMPQTQDIVARNARLTFWSAAIHLWCKRTNKLVFTLQETLAAFRRGTQVPLCIPEVLVHMNSTAEVLPISELPLGEQSQESWLRWGQRIFVATPARFTWNKFKKIVGVSNVEGTTYVDRVMLQEMCDQVIKRYWESAAKNYPVNLPVALPHLYHRINECIGSADNLHLIVETLAYQEQAATTVHNGTTYVKFLMPGDTSKPDITMADLAEINLLCALEQVQDNINNINAEITEQQNNAKSSLQSGSKVQALSCLRKKRRLEKSLSKQLGALENVSNCLQQLQETRINKQILHAFKTGMQAIRDSFANDISAEGVANTMDELQEVLEECKDINSVLATGVMEEDVDDSSLQEELDQLMSTDQKSLTHHDELIKSMSGLTLPDVPQSNPLSSLNAQPSSPTVKATP